MADDAAAPSGKLEAASEKAFEEAESTAAHVPQSEAIEADVDADGAQDVAKPAGVSHIRQALTAGLVAVVTLGGLAGWLGFRANESRNVAQQRELFLQVARQGAVNLTTLNYEHIDSDVQRILDSATGTFYDDFQQHAPSLLDVVERVKSKSVGTVTSAALESNQPTEAEVLVAVTMTSVIVGQPDQQPQSWRMRILVQKVEDDTKVSDVEFVP